MRLTTTFKATELPRLSHLSIITGEKRRLDKIVSSNMLCRFSTHCFHTRPHFTSFSTISAMALTSVSVAKPSFTVNAISNACYKPATMNSPFLKIVSAGDSQLFGTKISISTTRSMPARTFQKRRMTAVAKVSKGSVPPAFSLKDQDGRTVNLSKFKGKPVVLYFYPADESPGCTKEACAFRDSYEKFKKAGAEVVGISKDSPDSHKAFAKKYRLPFTLLSDDGDKVRKEWGVPGDFFGSLPGRETYVIDKKGVVQLVYNNQFQPEKHIDETLKMLESL